MNTYEVTFYAGRDSTKLEFQAETPEQALALARLFPYENWDKLAFDPAADINEIEVCDDDDQVLVTWMNEDTKLLRAAEDLLAPLEALCELPPDDAGERTIPAGLLDQARAAIAQAKGGPACRMNAPSLKRFRVTVIEWLSHNAVIEAPDVQAAEADARRLWAENAEHEVFSFDNSGIDGIEVEEISP